MKTSNKLLLGLLAVTIVAVTALTVLQSILYRG